MSHLIEFPWFGVIRMTGRDRARFLHGMCTNDIKSLAPGRGCRAAVVNRQGKMVAELAVLASVDALHAIVERSNLQPTIDHLSKFLVADDVSMSRSDLRAVGLYGIPPPEGQATAPEPALGGRIMAVGESSAEQISEAEYDSRRIENGFPRWGVDMGPEYLPMEAGLEAIAVSYSKGCYIGQEVIQRVKTYSEPPRMLVQLGIAGARTQEKITAKGEEIGHVTSAAKDVALGYVRREFKAPGTHVEVGGRPAHVRALPWQATIT
jgi:folate-binding protein YgfZ